MYIDIASPTTSKTSVVDSKNVQPVDPFQYKTTAFPALKPASSVFGKSIKNTLLQHIRKHSYLFSFAVVLFLSFVSNTMTPVTIGDPWSGSVEPARVHSTIPPVDPGTQPYDISISNFLIKHKINPDRTELIHSHKSFTTFFAEMGINPDETLLHIDTTETLEQALTRFGYPKDKPIRGDDPQIIKNITIAYLTMVERGYSAKPIPIADVDSFIKTDHKEEYFMNLMMRSVLQFDVAVESDTFKNNPELKDPPKVAADSSFLFEAAFSPQNTGTATFFESVDRMTVFFDLILLEKQNDVLDGRELRDLAIKTFNQASNSNLGEGDEVIAVPIVPAVINRNALKTPIGNLFTMEGMQKFAEVNRVSLKTAIRSHLNLNAMRLGGWLSAASFSDPEARVMAVNLEEAYYAIRDPQPIHHRMFGWWSSFFDETIKQQFLKPDVDAFNIDERYDPFLDGDATTGGARTFAEHVLLAFHLNEDEEEEEEDPPPPIPENDVYLPILQK
jgi:hypothetical protein